MANTLRFKRGLVSTIPTAALGEPLFTTDTFDLYIGNGTTNTRFQKYIASGTTSQYLRGDGSLATFPTNVITGTGVSGQVAYWSGASTQAGSNNLFYSTVSNILTITHPTGGVPLVVNNGATSGNVAAATIRNNSANTEAYSIRINSGEIIHDATWITSGVNMSHIWRTATSAGALANHMTLTSNGRLLLGSTSDNGLRFQVTGDGYFSGSVGIGATTFTDINLNVSKQLSGSVAPTAIYANGTITQTSTTAAAYFLTRAVTQAATFTLPNLYHFYSTQGTLGAGSTVTNQYGFFADSTIIGATNNYGFYGNIASGTGRWNLYMNGTAANYLAGSLSVGFASTAYLGIVSQVAGIGLHTSSTSGAAGLNLYENGSGRFSLRTLNGSAGLSFYDTFNNAERARIDASGNLGLGVVPSAWLAGVRAFEINSKGNAIVSSTSSQNLVTANAYFDGAWKYGSTAAASYYSQQSGVHAWFNAPSGTINTAITFTQAMTLDASGRLGIGTASPSSMLDVIQSGGTAGISVSGGINPQLRATDGTIAAKVQAITGLAAYIGTETNHQLRLIVNNSPLVYLFTTTNVSVGSSSDTGEKLQVNGTMRVSGASTLSGAVTMNAAVSGNNPILELSNSNTLALEFTDLAQAANNRKWQFNVNSGIFFFRAFNDARSSFTEIMQFTRTGAATFSSSVTAANLLVNTTTNDGYVSVNGNNSSRVFYGQGGATFPSANSLFRLDAGGVMVFNMLGSGATTFSSSIQAGTAIAIGTTPDTNKPFKILKNINGTVGINFENTSTGSSAFSAIQMGTDVTGGTKFTNLVYSSSGVTASGVYQPDGTSLINNGSGGLNFLGNPIRMYTGGSNGTLRWDMTNDGFITQYSGTNPSTNATDGYRQYSADVVAGNAAPHFRTENGAIIKLYQETTGVGNSIISLGGGNAVLDDTTFDGYTLRQIVKALRNQGILA